MMAGRVPAEDACISQKRSGRRGKNSHGAAAPRIEAVALVVAAVANAGDSQASPSSRAGQRVVLAMTIIGTSVGTAARRPIGSASAARSSAMMQQPWW